MYQDTISLLQPTVFVLRVCGVLPSALRRLHLPLSTKMYALLLALTFLIFLMATLLEWYSSQRGIAFFIAGLSIAADVIRLFLLIITAITSSESLVKFFRIMESVQRSLSSLNIRHPPNPSKKSQIVWIMVIFIPKLLAVCFKVRHLGFSSITFLVHVMVIAGTACKIRVLLDLVHHKFELLNWHLDDLNNHWPVFLPRPPDVSFRQLSCVREWRRTKFINEKDDNRTITPNKVKNFNKAHLKLVVAVKTLNSAFSTTFWAYIVPAIINLAPVLSFALNIKISSLVFFDLCFYLFGESTDLFIILLWSTKVQEQVQRTALLVHDLLDEKHHSLEVVEELQQFSMSLLHRKTTFTAGGFFDVNLKLLARIAGIIAPIILFLSQELAKSHTFKH